MPIPGQITPPMYSPFFDTQSKVVAVPKSTITHGPPYFSNAATAFTIRSAPTSAGFSYNTGIPVFTPGSMNNGFVLKYRSQTCRSVESRGGTTEETTIP